MDQSNPNFDTTCALCTL